MKLVQKITILLLAILIVVGTTGFKVEKFYCGSYLQSIHVFTSPTPCCSKSNKIGGKCHTDTEYIKADINGDLPILSQKIEQPISTAILIEVCTQLLFTQVELSPTKYLNYKPPLLNKNIPVLIQSFLI